MALCDQLSPAQSSGKFCKNLLLRIWSSVKQQERRPGPSRLQVARRFQDLWALLPQLPPVTAASIQRVRNCLRNCFHVCWVIAIFFGVGAYKSVFCSAPKPFPKFVRCLFSKPFPKFVRCLFCCICYFPFCVVARCLLFFCSC